MTEYKRPIHVERHELGPRFFLFGWRVHECHAGASMLAIGCAALAFGLPIHWAILAPSLVLGTWMIAKDWRDLFPSRRDTTAWRVAIHRGVRPFREARRADWLPPLAGFLTVIVGLVNIASTVTPDLGSRARLVRQVLPDGVPPLAHVFALQAGIALVIVGFYVARRRRRAWLVAVTALTMAGVLNLLKGLDIEEAAASWLLAMMLAWNRSAFWVRHDRGNWQSASRRITYMAGASCLAVATAVAGARWGTPHLTVELIPAEVRALITFTASPVQFPEPLEWMPAGVALMELGLLLAIGSLLFRPLGGPPKFPLLETRELARRLVEVHGRDTLSFFKLRADKHYLFDSEQRAFLAYRIEGGVLLISGDPVGPPDALPSLIRDVCAFAEVRGLKIGAVGASRGFAKLACGAGLRSFYIGDEAIVEVRGFSLAGRSIRKVRQSVSRLQKAGYVAKFDTLGSLDEATLTQLEAVSERWRGRSAERGFSMSMDGLRGEHLAGSTVVSARDANGIVRAFLHFVPVAGRSALSLSFMRREPGTPNGLMEFLVVQAIHGFRERGVDELSLNFAAFARLMHSPGGLGDRALCKLVSIANPYFQIESLYRFNAKFSPRWEPRYLLYEGPLGLPLTGLAALWAEGQLWKPRGRLAAQSTS
jgi:lysyl-tRNA synthetase class 2